MINHMARMCAGFGLCAALVAPVSAASAQVVAGEVASELEVATVQLELTESIAATGSTNGAAQVRELPGASVDPAGATMIVIHDQTGDLDLSVRSKNDGEWSDWVEIESSPDEAPDGLSGEEGSTSNSVALGPIWIGDATDVQVVETAGSVSSLTVDLLTDQTESLDAPLAALTNAGKPTIQPRNAWAGADHPWAADNGSCAGGPFYSDNVQAVIVHHTVTTNSYSQASSASMIRGIYYSHVRVNGWCDVAYNFLVDRFGTIWQGRSGDVARPVQGGHARGFNTSSAGIALLGQHQAGASPAASSPTPAAIGAVEAVAAWKLGLHGVDPRGTTWLKNRSSSGVMKFAASQWVQLPTIIGHRDVGLTSCPGSLAYPSVQNMGGRLSGGRVGSGPYNFPAWKAADHGPAILTVEQGGGIRPAFAADVPASAPGALAAGQVAVAVGGNRTRGYMLLNDGTLKSYGGAPSVSGKPGGSGADDLVVHSSGTSGWILRDAKIIGFGGQGSTSLPQAAVAFDVDDNGNGYAVTSGGTLLAIGSAPSRTLGGSSASGVVDVSLLPDGSSGWAVTSSGSLPSFGGARSDKVAVASARAVLASPSGLGGWVLDSEGRLNPFGDERPAIPISTTVGFPVAADAAIVDYVSGADVRGTKDGAYVDALAKAFLGRPATDVELDVWVSQLDYYSSEWLATRLSTSEEYAGAVVDEIYQNALGRAAEPAGRAYWLDLLQNGMPPQQLGIYFYGSEEFVIKNGGNSGFVSALYEVLLHRKAEPGGHAYWLELLDRGRAGPDGVASGFYESIESRRDRVTRLYSRFLGRAPEANGLDYWANRLQSVGDFVVAAQLATTEEFYNRSSSN